MITIEKLMHLEKQEIEQEAATLTGDDIHFLITLLSEKTIKYAMLPCFCCKADLPRLVMYTPTGRFFFRS